MKDSLLGRNTVMKLYYSPGACSLSPHIVLREAGLPFDLIKVDLKSKKTETGDDFTVINPKGYVPVLELERVAGQSTERLTEGPAIVQYLADQVPNKKLAPPSGTLERARLQEWLNFISTELHKTFSPLFSPSTPEDYKRQLKEKIVSRLSHVDQTLGRHGKPWLLGEHFSVADAYLFVVTSWARNMGIDIEGLANVGQYMGRVRERPAVAAALRAEGLAK
jgi:glutathione S-transferase